MSPIRRYVLLAFVLIAGFACSLISKPASPTATVNIPSPVPPSITPAIITGQASDTPAASAGPVPSDTPNPMSELLPAPFMNLQGGAALYLNPVGQPAQTWNGLPIMPEATAGQEYQSGAVYSFKASATIAQAVSFYSSKMPGLGFTAYSAPGTGSSGTGSNAMHNSFLYYYKGTQIILIYITSYDSDPGTVIVVIST